MSEPIVHELPAPQEAIDHGGEEILRAFVVEGELHLSLRNAFERPEVWGILLVDIARHVARMYSQDGTVLRDQALVDIRGAFDAEWAAPTDDSETDTIN